MAVAWFGVDLHLKLFCLKPWFEVSVLLPLALLIPLFTLADVEVGRAISSSAGAGKLRRAAPPAFPSLCKGSCSFELTRGEALPCAAWALFNKQVLLPWFRCQRLFKDIPAWITLPA